MKILLILHSKSNPGSGVIVETQTADLTKRVASLFAEGKGKDAFKLLVKEAVPELFVPAGQKVGETIPILIEDEID